MLYLPKASGEEERAVLLFEGLYFAKKNKSMEVNFY